jgi:hypothetical protein
MDDEIMNINPDLYFQIEKDLIAKLNILTDKN